MSVPAIRATKTKRGYFRTVKQRALVRSLKREGFFMSRSYGRHFIFQHPGHEGHVAVPHHAGDIPNGTLASILLDAKKITGRDLDI